MKYALYIILLALLPLLAGSGAAAEWQLPTIPVEEIRPGMTGFGKTIFYGEKIDTFGVVVIEVVKNFYPQQDVVIVRLTGERCEHLGVVAGMSGSPVYLDGRLAGAVALRLGEFQTEPIAGVMPIASMLATRDYEAARRATPPAAPSAGPHFLRGVLLGAGDTFWQHALASFRLAPESRLAGRRIETPLIFSGFSEAGLGAAAPWWNSLGFTPMAGGTALPGAAVGGGAPAAAADASKAALEPGSALSQVFIRGDFGMEMTGTVTAVEGDEILAFGHYLFNLGSTQMPMARSRILVTLPSLAGSSKMARALEVIGTIRQDRLTGVFGQVNVMPDWIPVTVQLRSRAGEQTFNFELADDPALRNLLPFFLRSALFQALITGKLGAEPSTVHLSGEIALKDGRRIPLNDFFSYQERLGFLGAGSEIAEAVDLVSLTLGALMVNDFAPPAVQAITLHAVVEPGERVAAIHAIRQDRLEVSPGDSLQLAITLRSSEGRELRYQQCICLPRYLKARSLTVIAGGADGMTRAELQANPEKYRPDSFDRLCEILQTPRAGSNLYVQVREPAFGMAVEGEELTALPPSILGVMSGRGGERSLRDRILAEWVIPTGYKITGIKRINVRITQPQRKQATLEPGFPENFYSGQP